MAKTNVENLLTNGRPKYIRCYVSKKYLKEGYCDPWTIVFTRVMDWQIPHNAPEWLKAAWRGRVWYIGMTQGGLICHGEADSCRFFPVLSGHACSL
jgi:hypothetical protein